MIYVEKDIFWVGFGKGIEWYYLVFFFGGIGIVCVGNKRCVN